MEGQANMQEMRSAKTRDRSLDVMKGILVLQMVLCHCIQFFGNESWPVQKQICDYINLTTFSGFLFTFGFACQYAYFRKSFREAAPHMAKNAVRMLIAFYLSGICYIAFVEYEYYDPGAVPQMLLLQKYPGWSEFLASFFGVILIGLVFFGLFRRMNGWILAGIGALSFGLTFLPYDRITHPWAALFVGSTECQTFPVLQYLFYFAAGVYLCKAMSAQRGGEAGGRAGAGGRGIPAAVSQCGGKAGGREGAGGKKSALRWAVPAAAVLLTIPELVFYLRTGELSGRFPPDAMFVFGAGAFVYLYYCLSRKLAKWNVHFLSAIGENAIFYLLFTNCVIFAFAGSNFKLRGIRFALQFYVLLMLSAWFCQHTVRRSER